MGKLVVSEFVTLDGVMEDPAEPSRPHGGWAFRFERGPEGDKFKLDEVMAANAMLLGRRTYEGFASVWPGQKDEVGFADKMNSIPKFVVSTTLRDPEWDNTKVIHGEEVGSLKSELQGDILVAGSCQLVPPLVAPRPGRRIPPHGLPGHPGGRKAPLRRRGRRRRPSVRAEPAGGAVRDPHLPAAAPRRRGLGHPGGRTGPPGPEPEPAVPLVLSAVERYGCASPSRPRRFRGGWRCWS